MYVVSRRRASVEVRKKGLEEIEEGLIGYNQALSLSLSLSLPEDKNKLF